MTLFSFSLTRPKPLRRSVQISESHCGPAVMQMLLANLGIEVSQQQVAAAGGALYTLEAHGMRVDQLAQAVKRLAPNVQFWSKSHANLDDLILLVNQYRYPVGVEWQGSFMTPEEEQKAYADGVDEFGHYSIISHIDEARHELILTDPYQDFASKDRIFTYREFLPRWWDTNEVIDPATRKPYLQEDTRALFVVTPLHATFPTLLKMKPGGNLR